MEDWLSTGPTLSSFDINVKNNVNFNITVYINIISIGFVGVKGIPNVHDFFNVKVNVNVCVSGNFNVDVNEK